MAQVNAVSNGQKGTTSTPVEVKPKKSDYVTLTRKDGAKINVLNTLFKKYEQAKNIEGIDTIELNNGVVVDVLESTSAGVMTIDGGGSSESAFTNIDGKEMKISIDAINKKGDVISVSSKLDATAKVEQGDVINNESLEVKVPFKPQKTDF